MLQGSDSGQPPVLLASNVPTVALRGRTVLDVRQILGHYGISYVDAPHPNVSPGCVGVCCPFCGDQNYHLGIFLDHGNWSCWRCKRSGQLSFLISSIIGVSTRQISQEIHQQDKRPPEQMTIQDAVRQRLEEGKADPSPPRQTSKAPPLPAEAKAIGSNPPWKPLRAWLRRRRFTAADCQKWGALYAPYGTYGYRLITPIHDLRGRYAGFQGRDVTDTSKQPYRFPPGSDGFHSGNHLYGLHRVRGKLVIVTEGVFDVWRVGKNAVASFGVGLSAAQRQLLYTGNYRLILAWDGETVAAAEQEQQWWNGLGHECKVAHLPGQLDPDDVIRNLGRRIWNEIMANAR